MLDSDVVPPNYDFITPDSTEKRYYSFTGHPEVHLDSKASLSLVTVAYETYGALDEAAQNAVLICHALTGDSHVASHPGAHGDTEGWWEAVVGPGRPIDTDRYFVISSNVIGGCQGSTGPWSMNPSTGRPYGMRFPIVTIRDMVRVQKALLDHLGVRRLVSVVGGSMGGMQVLEWALMYPDMVGSIIPIATCGRMSPQGIAYNEAERRAIMADPKWNHGDYYYGEQPADGLSAARTVGMITYQSDQSMAKKFGRAWQNHEALRYSWEGMFQIESYLRYQGIKLVRRFDANTYLYLSRSMDLHDVGYGRGSYESVLGGIRAKALTIGIDSDILFPTYQQKELTDLIRMGGGDAEYHEIHSACGHDAFLIEFDMMDPVLRGFLDSVS